MRCLLIASVLVGLACTGAKHHHCHHKLPQRKSLGFGPTHPHAVFHSNPYQIVTNGFSPFSPETDPLTVAQAFIENILGDKVSARSWYKIRKDSYTDQNTGVTHVYVRQVVNGLEVADGDMNINVKDGMVLSYGNSFFSGPLPSPFTNPDHDSVCHPHADLCDELEDQVHQHTRLFLEKHGKVLIGDIDVSSVSLHSIQRRDDMAWLYLQSPAGQHILDVTALEDEFHTTVGQIMKPHIDNCAAPSIPSSLLSNVDFADMRPALLRFMVSATPSQGIASDILDHYEEYVQKMTISTEHSFAPDGVPTIYVDNVPDTVNPVKASLAYVQVPNKAGDAMHLTLVWRFEVEMQDNWYETAVSAALPHDIISVVDWASDAPVPDPTPDAKPAVYNVFPWGTNDPAEGDRKIMEENYDSRASPVGWHTIPFSNDPAMRGVRMKAPEFYRNTTTTWGNNVFAQENWEGQNSFIDNYRPDGGADKVFDHKYAPKGTNKTEALEEAYKYINATVAQLFYTCNLVHDLYYRYGFDEVSGNFQQYNFKRGGAENDAVIANAQDGSGFNNANFMTPPDGQNGRMRMYLWNTAVPYRDGDLEAGIVIHEYSHGLSTRLTGGPANSGCLGFGESGGMGEGWGDFLATTIRSTSNYSDYAMGSWAANRDSGIRNYPYSLNETINPSTYKILDQPGYWGVHAVGEVWAQMLWIVSQRLIAVHGYSDELFPPKPDADGTVPEGDFYRPRVGKKPHVPKHGNTLSVQLVISGMKLQPCRPSFFDARDAIIAADQQLTGGENFCTLWNGFAERGLGQDAKVEGRTPWGGGIRTNGHLVPMTCRH